MYYDPYSKDQKCMVFDIETTGLYFNRDRIISASFISPDGSGLVQYFCEDSSFEGIITEQIMDVLSDCDAVITYNGQGFDLPFVLSRARKYGIAEKLPLFRSIDVYKWLKSYWPLASSMPSLRQKAVEEALGLSDSRDDRIGGEECIRLYSEYVNLGRQEARDLILLHNGDDVRQLAAVTRSLSFLDYPRIAFEKGFLIKLESRDLLGSRTHKVLTSSAELSKGQLRVKARIEPACIPAAFYEGAYSLRSASEGNVSLEVYVREEEGYAFADLKDLGLSESDFSSSAMIESGYAVLSVQGDTKYSTCNELIKLMLKRLV